MLRNGTEAAIGLLLSADVSVDCVAVGPCSSSDTSDATAFERKSRLCILVSQAQIRAGMVAEDRQLRQAMQQSSSYSDGFASDADLSETTGKLGHYQQTPF